MITIFKEQKRSNVPCLTAVTIRLHFNRYRCLQTQDSVLTVCLSRHPIYIWLYDDAYCLADTHNTTKDNATAYFL